MQDTESSSWLSSMPHSAIQTVIHRLSSKDRQSLAGSCRSLAAAVSMAAEDTKCTVTSSTGWQGLSKILSTRTMHCKTLVLRGSVNYQQKTAVDMKAHVTLSQTSETLECCTPEKQVLNESTDAINALDVLLASEQPPTCSFPGVQRVHIDARPLRCLLPANIVSAFPSLEELEIEYAPGQFTDDTDLQPLPYCKKLQQISFIARYASDTPLQLPARYHTAGDLTKQLPNILSVKLKPDARPEIDKGRSVTCMETILNAWGDQLTQLDLTVSTESVRFQQCTRLRSLAWRTTLAAWRLQFPPDSDSIPLSLTNLSVDGAISELHLQTILKLPTIRKLCICSFYKSLQHNWSLHPCTWRQLQVKYLLMEELPKLPLHSLRGKGCLKISILRLPDPFLPDSLAHVKHAVQCVRRAKMMIDGVSSWECHTWEKSDSGDKLLSHELDTASVELLLAASRVAQPANIYTLQVYDVACSPQTTAALFKWLSPRLQELRVRSEQGAVQPWFWQGLQSCRTLERVVFDWAYRRPDANVSRYLTRIRTLVLQAAEHLVAVTCRPLKLVLFNMQMDTKQLPGKENRALMFRRMLQEALPTSIDLQACAWDYHYNLVICLGPLNMERRFASSSKLQGNDTRAASSCIKATVRNDAILAKSSEQGLAASSKIPGVSPQASFSFIKATDRCDSTDSRTLEQRLTVSSELQGNNTRASPSCIKATDSCDKVTEGILEQGLTVSNELRGNDTQAPPSFTKASDECDTLDEGISEPRTTASNDLSGGNPQASFSFVTATDRRDTIHAETLEQKPTASSNLQGNDTQGSSLCITTTDKCDTDNEGTLEQALPASSQLQGNDIQAPPSCIKATDSCDTTNADTLNQGLTAGCELQGHDTQAASSCIKSDDTFDTVDTEVLEQRFTAISESQGNEKQASITRNKATDEHSKTSFLCCFRPTVIE